ncbi:hypothetical protein HOU49_gp47 [Arthrobacter phage Eileen]|uniref:Uncharacterized protein n=1 Tax=Arthrobacter phage Eileen TaxID=2419956 RepID=A0A3G2KFW2_9CAUD|nr:hypothetical protein HOU49_gp47 [Arthrobacter phage Eileen]AYN57835.1 hypothetical protein PBI_EILEEN_47 [Arthrobacter phage Eileen]
MSAFVKSYPRAKVTRHKTLDGWVIDLYLRATAKPIRVNSTYASITWAHKAAAQKLGVKAKTVQAAAPVKAPAPKPGPAAPAAPVPTMPRGTKGTCGRCHRPMRPAGSKAADYPGTTLRQREGLCQSCHQSSKRLAP